jgi:undecaprenyl-diphosphatase
LAEIGLLAAVVLGAVQGVTEWLPVSSKSMVALAARFGFGIDYGDGLGFALWLHSGTLVSSVVYLRNDVAGILRAMAGRGDRELAVFLAIATVVSAAIGAPLLFLSLSAPLADPAFTLLMGAFLVVMAMLQRDRVAGSATVATRRDAFWAGVAQGLSALPGVSRSGVTVAALLARRLSLEEAFRLSFLMSIPIVLGLEVVLALFSSGVVVSAPFAAGAAVAAVVGFVSMGALLKVAARPDFHRITLALGVLVLLLGVVVLLAGA